MKNKISYFIFALLFALPFALSSCSDDDNGLSDDLVGTWKESDALSSALNYTVYVQFQEDGTYIEVDCAEGDDADVSEGRWVRNGSTVTISGGDFTKTSTTIKKLTSSSLVLSTLGIETTYVKVSDSEIKKYLD